MHGDYRIKTVIKYVKYLRELRVVMRIINMKGLFWKHVSGWYVVVKLHCLTIHCRIWVPLCLSHFPSGDQIRRIRWVRHVARMEEETNACMIFGWGPSCKEEPIWKTYILMWRIILKWMLNRIVGRALDYYGSVEGQVAGCCECGNEPSGSITRGEFVD